MAKAVINSSGVGASQVYTITTSGGAGANSIVITNTSRSPIKFDVATAGTIVQSGLSVAGNSFKIVSGLNDGLQTIENVKTSHGTSAQNNELVYNAMATGTEGVGSITIDSSGNGGAQSGTVTTSVGAGLGQILINNDSDSAIIFDVATAGTVVQSAKKLQAKSSLVVTGLNNGAQTLVNLKNAHGTGAQNGEKVYISLIGENAGAVPVTEYTGVVKSGTPGQFGPNDLVVGDYSGPQLMPDGGTLTFDNGSSQVYTLSAAAGTIGSGGSMAVVASPAFNATDQALPIGSPITLIEP